MKVRDLIDLLQQQNPDHEVYGYCDHGQSPEKVSPPSVVYVKDAYYSLSDEWIDDAEEAEDYGYTTQVVLL